MDDYGWMEERRTSLAERVVVLGASSRVLVVLRWSPEGKIRIRMGVEECRENSTGACREGREVGSTSGDSTTPSSNSTLVDTDYIDGSTVPKQVAGIFWAILNRFLIIGQTVVLLLSEFGWPSVFFNRFFPVLGDDFGLGALGIIQCLIGAAALSHHVDDFILVSAFFLFSIGCLNMLAGLIFWQSAKTKCSVTSWRDHAKSALPTYVAGIPVPTSVPSFVSNAFNNEEKGSDAGSKAGFGFGRQGEKAAGLKGFLISKPLESLPRYAAKPASSG